jgi:histidine ammonia-lyase
MKTVILGDGPLSIENLAAIARENARAEISPAARARVGAARALVDRWVQEGRAVYGVTTGFGALCDVAIPREQTRALQENILMSHAAGVGDLLPGEVVRAIMAVRIQDLSKGRSGVRCETLDALVQLLNSGIVPVVPEKGSVGASGDLAPMAHLALVMIGKGEAFHGGVRMSGAKALAAAGLCPVQLESGEGLALINGTQAMAAITALAVHDAERLAMSADIAC